MQNKLIDWLLNSEEGKEIVKNLLKDNYKDGKYISSYKFVCNLEEWLREIFNSETIAIIIEKALDDGKIDL